MTHELFLSGQYIWNQGVVKSGMICIKRGVLEMLSDEDDESPMIAFKEGTVSYHVARMFTSSTSFRKVTDLVFKISYPTLIDLITKAVVFTPLK